MKILIQILGLALSALVLESCLLTSVFAIESTQKRKHTDQVDQLAIKKILTNDPRKHNSRENKQEQNQVQQKFSIPVKGLPNVANSCYMNAALQCLFQIPEIAYLIEHTDTPQVNPLLHVCKEIVDNTKQNNEITILTNTVKLFKQVNEQYFGKVIAGQQQDANELILRLIDSIPLFQPLFFFSQCFIITCIQCQQSIKPINMSIYNLSLKIPQAPNGTFSLQNIINTHFFPEIIYDFKCPHCLHSTVQANKRLYLNNYPNYLLINCEQSSGKSIQFPVHNLRFNQPNTPDYELTGVILHSGTQEHGHYISLVKEASSNQWYLCDDIFVFKLDQHISGYTIDTIAAHGRCIDFSPCVFLYARLPQTIEKFV